MKEEWKVYIKGVPNRGNEVINILSTLGGKDPFINDGDDYNPLKDYLNDSKSLCFIGHDGNIHWDYINTEQSKIIMDNYKEIKLPEKWRDGDILINNDGTDYKVFWEYDSDSDTSFYAHNISVRIDGTLTKYTGSIWHGEKILCYQQDYRLATPSEVKHFHELLHTFNRDWDTGKMELVDWKWKPKIGEKYFYINSIGRVQVSELYSCGLDGSKKFFGFGNYFKTKEEAEVMAEKVRKLLKS